MRIGKNWLKNIAVPALLLGLVACGTPLSPGGTPAETAVGTHSPSADVVPIELTISAAASMTDSLKEIQKLYEAKANVKLSFNFGASGSLQQQIEQGAPVDLFVSASTKNMKALLDKKLVEADKQGNVVSNELVVIVPADGHVKLDKMEDLPQAGLFKVAVGEPASVPAGSYAKEALMKLKLWEPLQPILVLTKDVRQVLTYVESGNADAGFVYRSDAQGSTKSKVAFAVDPTSYTPIDYPVGVITASKHPKEAQALYDYLRSAEAQAVFTRYGFAPPRQ
jgi:molybdate transport system substrate-binding protein